MRAAVKENESKTNVKEELKEAFVLWKNTSKAGNEYLSGKDEVGKLIAYFNSNKKNPKEPDIRVYSVNEDGKTHKEVASLWDNISEKSKKRYLTGSTDEKEKLVGFYGTKEKAPYIRVYFRKENTDLPF